MRRSIRLVGLLALAVVVGAAAVAVGGEVIDDGPGTRGEEPLGPETSGQQPSDPETSGQEAPGAETSGPETHGPLEQRWLVEETRTSVGGNHHQPAVVRPDGEPLVVVPLNGRDEDCRVVALDADGERVWHHQVEPAECHAHAVGDVATGSFPGPEQSVLLATGSERALALSAGDGEVRATHDLPDFGYSPPVALESPERTLVVADFTGTVVAVGPDGAERWTHELDGWIWARPAVAPVGDGRGVVVTGGESGDYGLVRGLDASGEPAWTVDLPGPTRTQALATVDGEPAVVLGTDAGSVVAVRTRDGEVLWERSLAGTLRVDADEDGVYAVGDDGTVRRLDPADGGTVWERSLGGPYEVALRVELADVDDGPAAPAVLTPDGGIHLLAPADGATLARYDAARTVYSPPATADVTGSGRDDLVVVDEDGRVALLTYEPDDASRAQTRR